MAIESAFSQIKTSEKFAEDIINNASKDAHEMIKNAKKESEKIKTEKLEKARNKAELNRRRNMTEAEAEIQEIEKNAKEEITRLKELSENRKASAVNFIILSVLE
jgi:vacuolar-type H+-ATPase subunit H